MRLEVIRWSEAGHPDENELERRLAAEGFEAFRWHDPPGSRYEPHSHDHDESLWVIDGKITFGVGGTEHALGPGDRLMLPKGTVHTAQTDEEGATYWIGERSEE